MTFDPGDRQNGVSVIIPTHDRNEELKRAIRSVFSQTYRNFEIIVIDDTGSASEVTMEFPDIRYIFIHPTRYPAEARNAGIEASRREYIAFLDDDDCWYPDKLCRQVTVLKNYPEIGLVCGNGMAGDCPYLSREIKNEIDMLHQEILGDFVVTSSTMIRASLLKETGLYFVDASLPVGEDYDFSIRFAAVSGVWYDPIPLFEYTVSQDSIQNRGGGSFTDYHRGVLRVMIRIGWFLERNHLMDPTSRLLIWYRGMVAIVSILYNGVKDSIRNVISSV